MGTDVIARRALDYADVRLRLRQVIEADRTLHLNEPPVSERALERLRHEQHRRPVRARLRLLHEQEPVEQLDRLVLVEEPVVDQPLVLQAGPAAHRGPLRVVHARMLSAPYGGVNVSGRLRVWMVRRKTSSQHPLPSMMFSVSATLTPLRLSLLAVVLVVAGFAYLQFRSGWVEVDERDFDRRVLQARRPALVYFDTAIGCRGADGVFRKLSRQWRGALDVFYVNSIDHPGLAGR